MLYKLVIEDKIDHSLCLIIFLYSFLDLQEDFEKIANKKSKEKQCKNSGRTEKGEKGRKGQVKRT